MKETKFIKIVTWYYFKVFLWIVIFFIVEVPFVISNNHVRENNVLNSLKFEKELIPDTIKNLHYYINIGAGLANGGRLGFLFKFSNSLSAEFSYGNDVRNFIDASDEESRLTFGLNWHSNTSFPWIISSQFTYAKSPSESRIENPRYLFSFNAGYLNMKSRGLKLLVRAGFYIELFKFYYTQKVKFGGIYPNCELAVGWVF